MTEPETVTVSDADMSRFERDGFLILPALYHLDEIKAWKRKVFNTLSGLQDIPNGVRVWMAEALPD